MDVTTLYSIGELSRRTGVPVKTIRFYSDSGVEAPTTRSPAGYRLYDLDALLRLELLRTLRELGMRLAVIRRLLTWVWCTNLALLAGAQFNVELRG